MNCSISPAISVEVGPDPLAVAGDPGEESGSPQAAVGRTSGHNADQLPGGKSVLPSQERSATVTIAAVLTYLPSCTQELLYPVIQRIRCSATLATRLDDQVIFTPQHPPHPPLPPSPTPPTPPAPPTSPSPWWPNFCGT